MDYEDGEEPSPSNHLFKSFKEDPDEPTPGLETERFNSFQLVKRVARRDSSVKQTEKPAALGIKEDSPPREENEDRPSKTS